MRTLRQLRITGFKSIADAELTFTDLDILIGANGSGKSNLIGVFRLLEWVLSRNLQLYVAGEPDCFLHHGRKTTPAPSLDFTKMPTASNSRRSRTRSSLSPSASNTVATGRMVSQSLLVTRKASLKKRLAPTRTGFPGLFFPRYGISSSITFTTPRTAHRQNRWPTWKTTGFCVLMRPICRRTGTGCRKSIRVISGRSRSISVSSRRFF